MRVNIYLNEKNLNDKKIIEFLETKYNSSAYIKELLFALSTGSGIEILTPGTNVKDEVKEEEVYEKIIGLNDVDL
ncbi:MAG: hypothetical protein ACRC7N_14590 [Clostridium sp.]